MPVRRITMYPYGGAGGLEGGHALGQQSRCQARQHIAGARSGKGWRGVAVDCGAAIGTGDYCISAFKNDNST